jgi:NADP-dependent 3-hydroxy acid dehydrogenase YdfG
MMIKSIALITGATSGIGKASAAELAQQGYNLILTGRRADRLAAFSEQIKTTYQVEVLTLCFDIRSRQQTFDAIASLPGEWKDIDILVNNAGLAAGLETIDKADIDDWEQMIDTNVKGLLYITRAVSPLMVARKKGHIINISSIAGHQVYANASVYCATKHAVEALNKGMRIDLLPFGIKVSAIAPGMVETEFSIVRFKGDEDRAASVYKGLTPLSATDIADALGFIVSRPAHVCINEMLIMPTAQANATSVKRD